MNLKWEHGDTQLRVMQDNGEQYLIQPSCETGGTHHGEKRDSIAFKWTHENKKYRVQFQVTTP